MRLEENYTTSPFHSFSKKQYNVEMHYAMTGIGSKKGFYNFYQKNLPPPQKKNKKGSGFIQKIRWYWPGRLVYIRGIIVLVMYILLRGVSDTEP